MSADKSDENKEKGLVPGKKLDPDVLEEDDEFEEFPVEDWQEKDGDEDDDLNVWEDNWDDESVEDDFSKQLKAELEKHGIKSPGQ